MSSINFISEKLILPLSDLLTRQYISKYFKLLQKSQWWSTEKLREFQNQRLRKLIEHSVNTVPYYRELFKKHDLCISDIKTIDDLNKIPVLTKEIIKQEGIEKFTSEAIPQYKLKSASTSGSTGEPLFYYTTREAYSFNLAAYLRGWYWAGYRLGDRYTKLSQNPRNKPIKRLQDAISNNMYLSTNPLNEKNYEYILRRIDEFKPKAIRCYPDPLLFLARYKLNNDNFSHSPQFINTTGNTLHDETREEIEKAFNCKIFDSYNCEGNPLVFECHTHKCYHSTEEYGLSEIVNDDGQEISNGIGHLISTDLWNFAHPFIRYKTQDLVEVSDKECECGRNLLRIDRIIGRDNDVLEVDSGRKFIVHNFTVFFSHTDITELNRSVEQFQVVKYSEFILFRIVPNNRYSYAVSNFIRSHWEDEMGCKVKVETVGHIPLTKSGKRKFIIDKT